MKTLDLTREGLVRALAIGLSSSRRIDAALRARAEDVGRRRGGEGAAARIVRRGAGRYGVEISGLGFVAHGGSPAAPEGTADPSSAEH
jgi:hypothetical protein